MSQSIIFQSKYLLDTNCFINLERFYPHDVFKSLDTIIWQNIQSDNIQTIKAIYYEDKNGVIDKMLNRYSSKEDMLILNNASGSINDVLEYVTEKIEKIADHHNIKSIDIKKDFEEKNKGFLGSGSSGKILGSDALLIAKASDMGRTVVTEETKAKDSMAKTIKIPDVCEQLKVKCINFLELLRTENVKF